MSKASLLTNIKMWGGVKLVHSANLQPFTHISRRRITMHAAWLFAFVVSLSFTACVNHIPSYEEADTRAEAENQESDSTLDFTYGIKPWNKGDSVTTSITIKK